MAGSELCAQADDHRLSENPVDKLRSRAHDADSLHQAPLHLKGHGRDENGLDPDQ
jgi:hypothetical protein